jgi:hypothetical protein
VLFSAFGHLLFRMRQAAAHTQHPTICFFTVCLPSRGACTGAHALPARLPPFICEKEADSLALKPVPCQCASRLRAAPTTAVLATRAMCTAAAPDRPVGVRSARERRVLCHAQQAPVATHRQRAAALGHGTRDEGHAAAQGPQRSWQQAWGVSSVLCSSVGYKTHPSRAGCPDRSCSPTRDTRWRTAARRCACHVSELDRMRLQDGAVCVSYHEREEAVT